MLRSPVNELLEVVVVILIIMAMIVIRVAVTMTQDHVVVILQETMIVVMIAEDVIHVHAHEVRYKEINVTIVQDLAHHHRDHAAIGLHQEIVHHINNEEVLSTETRAMVIGQIEILL